MSFALELQFIEGVGTIAVEYFTDTQITISIIRPQDEQPIRVILPRSFLMAAEAGLKHYEAAMEGRT